MQTLHNLEKLEIEVLELLNSIKALDSIYFGGGTMLDYAIILIVILQILIFGWM